MTSGVIGIVAAALIGVGAGFAGASFASADLTAISQSASRSKSSEAISKASVASALGYRRASTIAVEAAARNRITTVKTITITRTTP